MIFQQSFRRLCARIRKHTMPPLHLFGLLHQANAKARVLQLCVPLTGLPQFA